VHTQSSRSKAKVRCYDLAIYRGGFEVDKLMVDELTKPARKRSCICEVDLGERQTGLDSFETNLLQIIEGRVVELRLTRRILNIPGWHDDHHSLSSTG